jgi:hypothetical protein
MAQVEGRLTQIAESIPGVLVDDMPWKIELFGVTWRRWKPA